MLADADVLRILNEENQRLHHWACSCIAMRFLVLFLPRFLIFLQELSHLG